MAMITSTKHKNKRASVVGALFWFPIAIDMGDACLMIWGDAISCHLRRHPGESRREWGGCGR